MNTIPLTLMLALLGAGEGDQAQKLIDPNEMRDVSVLVTSAQASYVNQGYLEQTFPEAFFYFNSEFKNTSNEWVDAGRFSFKKSNPTDTIVKGKFKNFEGDFQYSLPAEDFFNELSKLVTEIDSTYYFAPSVETSKDPLTTIEVQTKAEKLKSATTKFFILPRKAKTPANPVATNSSTPVKPEYEYPAAERSILVEFGHRETIEAKINRLKVGMNRAPLQAPPPDPAKPSAIEIGKELFREHYDMVPLKISVRYEPPGSPREPKMLGKHAVVAHPSQSQGLMVLPIVGLERARELTDQGIPDLRTNPALVRAIIRQPGQPAARRPIIGFDIDADEFLQRVVGPELQAVSHQENHSCLIFEQNPKAVQDSACKRLRQGETIKDWIEVRFTPGQAHKPQVFRVWDTEMKLHVFQVQIQVESDLSQTFTAVAPVLKRK